MKKLIISILMIYSSQINAQDTIQKNMFQPPLDIPLTLSGTFGELRSNHFHSGIDIKTNQEIGLPIFAPASGYISRLKISPTGFGKAIYLSHANGLTTVYAHLDRFNKDVHAYVLNKQYELKQFSIDVFLEKNTFKIDKGQIIGYTGNSGSSSGPHLHFEIRNSKNQNPVNPMHWNFPIVDTKKPIIESIFIYDLNNPVDIKKKKIKKEGGLTIVGTFAIGIQAYDLLDLASNKNGINSIQIYLDNQLYYHFEIQEFSFNETKYINSLIDYQEFFQTKQKIYKCYIEENNQLSTYHEVINHGIMENLSEQTHTIKIIVKDSYENAEEKEFSFVYKKEKKDDMKQVSNIIHWNQDFVFQNETIEILIPKKSLYTDCLFSFNQETKKNKHTEYTIMNGDIPLQQEFKISIKPDDNVENMEDLILVQIKNKDTVFVQSKWEDNKIVGSPRSFGVFTLVKDTESPKVTIVSFSDDLSNQTIIKFRISDNLSGIKEYIAEIDDEWVLMEYDAKNQLLEHTFMTKPTNTKHKLYIQVFDYNGNFIEKELYFVR